jgi:hypothetical protein
MRRRRTPAATRRSLVVVFEREEDLLAAARAARAEGHALLDAFAPYPVHGLDEAMALRPSRIPYVGFAAGLLGLALGVALQVWTSAVDWPLDVGGKPRSSLPAFVPVAFELVILLAGLGAFAAFLLRGGRSGLRPPVSPRLADDRFALVLSEGREPWRLAEFGARARAEHRAVEVREGLLGGEDGR